MLKARNHTQNGWADGECLDYSVSPCIKLSENCSLSDPAALYGLYEKQAERYFHVTKSGVLTGFSSLQKRCITKNEHCCSSLAKFLSFVSWKAWTAPYCWQWEEKKDLRLKACAFVGKQDALGRELVQVQERSLLRTPFVRCRIVAACLEPVYLWQTVTGVFHRLLHRTAS